MRNHLCILLDLLPLSVYCHFEGIAFGISLGSPEKKNRERKYVYVCVCGEIYYKELTHMIIEIKKTQDL